MYVLSTFQGGKVWSPASGVLPALPLLMGSLSLYSFFSPQENLPTNPHCFMPSETSYLLFQYNVQDRGNKVSGTTGSHLLALSSAHVSREGRKRRNGQGARSCSLQKESKIVSMEGHQRSSRLVMSFHREAKAPARGNTPGDNRDQKPYLVLLAVSILRWMPKQMLSFPVGSPALPITK